VFGIYHSGRQLLQWNWGGVVGSLLSAFFFSSFSFPCSFDFLTSIHLVQPFLFFFSYLVLSLYFLSGLSGESSYPSPHSKPQNFVQFLPPFHNARTLFGGVSIYIVRNSEDEKQPQILLLLSRCCGMGTCIRVDVGVRCGDVLLNMYLYFNTLLFDIFWRGGGGVGGNKGWMVVGLGGGG